MQKNIYLIVGAIVLLAIGVWVIFSGKANTPGSTSKQASRSLSLDSGVKCVRMNAVGDAGTSEGTMYFYKDIVRYDSVINHKELGKRDMHILVTKDKTYVWGSAFQIPGISSGGMVYSNDAEDNPAQMQKEDIEMLKKNNFKVPGMQCEEWTPDQNMLTPPKDIKFSTQEEMMQNMMKGFAPSGAAGFGPMGGMAVPCDTCDKITNQAMKEKCKKQCVSK